MKKRLILFIAVVALCSCNKSTSDENAFVVEGSISGIDVNGETVFLVKLDEETNKFVVLDSVVIKNNIFLLKGTADTVEVGIIYVDDMFDMEIVLEPGKINVSVLSDLIFTRSGTTFNDTLQSLYTQFDAIRKKQDEQIKQFSESDRTPEQALELDLKLYALSNEYTDALISFIKSNMDNSVGQYFAVNYLEHFDIEIQEELLNLADDNFKSKDKIQTVINNLDKTKKTIGTSFKNFTLTNPKGKKASLSDYAGKGKYVLVDFWASWCAPCRRSMPYLVSLYDKYKAKDFEIVGVSLDDDKTAWTNAIDNLRMTWVQLSDLKGWNSEAARIYNVNSIPHTLLLDKGGKIIALNPHGIMLDKKLEELLK